MDIAVEIPYWGPQVATFDPEKVLCRLKEHFPEAEIDPTDWTEREVASLNAYLQERAITARHKDPMRSQIRGKARRNGPLYRFRLTDGSGAEIQGYSSRYRVVFRSDHDINEVFRRRITDFLRSLGLGNLIVR
jgi:hypothetical protein